MIIPEQRQYTGNIPDVVVGKAATQAATLSIPGPTTVIMKLHLVMELKK